MAKIKISNHLPNHSYDEVMNCLKGKFKTIEEIESTEYFTRFRVTGKDIPKEDVLIEPIFKRTEAGELIISEIPGIENNSNGADIGRIVDSEG